MFLTHSSTLLFTVSILSLASYRAWKLHVKRQIEDQYALQKGCRPPRKWSAKWPQGLDLLLRVFRHARHQTILQFFLEVLEESGTTHEQQLLGARGINTIDPQNIEEILSNQFEDFTLGLRPVHFSPLLGHGIFTQDGPEWKHSRALLRPQFASNRFANFSEIQKCVESLLSNIPKDGGVVDLMPLFFRLTFDTTTFLLFGETMGSLQDSHIAGQESEFAEAFNTAQDYLSHRGRLGDFYWLANTPTFRKACRTSHRFIDEAVRRALSAPSSTSSSTPEKKQYIFIDALIQETRNPQVLRDQCLNILLAGRDTTAACLSWTLHLLARHPHIQSKLRAEISSTVGLGETAAPPSREDLKRMSYLDIVLKEVLRLYPSVPVNSRAAQRTTTLPVGGGPDGLSPILVRAGEAVGYCVYALHRRTDIYGADAHEFRPERWENRDLARRVGYGYLPFNGGPRLCLGKDFALLEAGYTVVRVMQRFSFIGVPEGEVVVPVGKERQMLTLVVAPGDGCRVDLRTEG